MIHSKPIEEEKLKKRENDSKSAKTGDSVFSQSRSCGQGRPYLCQKFSDRGSSNALTSMFYKERVSIPKLQRGNGCNGSFILLALDGRTRLVTFNVPNKPIMSWEGGNCVLKGKFISSLKARKMISKDCIYHLFRVRDIDSKTPTLGSIPIVNEFLEVFIDDLLDIPPEIQINVVIDLLPNTQIIVIPPYHMAAKDFNKLKNQLKGLLDKDHALYAMCSKCDFLLRFVSILGHIVSGEGYILMQHGKVISYSSRQLKVHENNYPTHYLDLVAMVFVIMIWRYYLYGVQVDVFTDHRSFKYVFTQKDLNLFRKRWLELLKDYDMSVLYHPSKVNVVADALSWLSMESIGHVEEYKRELVCDVHRLARLGVLLVDSNEGGLYVQNCSESFFVSDVKVKKDLDPDMVDLKKSVSEKSMKAFS
ncbi:hypothetical protein MTR67_002126 [Solanum verrucosum]|uniref:Reverse transcriptase RNase H-like domain-containing protein n=1 Tax=Solanum verrucosum TaxID=315347 RepID=A0AAF0PU27_SOLVR|nr:hypothetical protein MTR67_002126 [Solanum verrucosum]